MDGDKREPDTAEQLPSRLDSAQAWELRSPEGKIRRTVEGLVRMLDSVKEGGESPRERQWPGLRVQAGPGQQCSPGGVWETGILGEWTEVSPKDSQVALSELSPDCCLFHPPLPLPKFLSSAGSSGGQGAGRRRWGAAPVPLPLSQSPPSHLHLASSRGGPEST